MYPRDVRTKVCAGVHDQPEEDRGLMAIQARTDAAGRSSERSRQRARSRRELNIDTSSCAVGNQGFIKAREMADDRSLLSTYARRSICPWPIHWCPMASNRRNRPQMRQSTSSLFLQSYTQDANGS
ncbi:hypothetical protein KM043_013109 [Ampulex compressa]|nr:hypothetical protein KM043_013109 [Ampulex compressa]